MLGTTVDGSSSKSDLEGNLNHEESYPLSEDKEALKNFQKMEDANEQLPLKGIENVLRKRSSVSSSKSPGKKSTPSGEKLGSSVTDNKATKSSAEHTSLFSFSPNGNRESKDTTTVDIELQDDCFETSSNRTDSNEEEHRLISSQFFSYIYSTCEGEGFDKTDFYQNIDLLHAEHCLYNVLLSQNKNGDTPLHVAVKKNKVNLTKEILRILDEPYKSDSSYKDKYFEHEKPLSKVINTKNKKGEDVIALAINGNNEECTSTIFRYLSYGKETTQSLIKRCNDEIGDLRKESVDNDKKSARTKRDLLRGQRTFALFAGAGSCIQIFRQISGIAFGVTDRDTPYAGSVIGEFLDFFAALPGLMILSNYVAGRMLSSYEKKDSSLEGRLKSCIKEREKLENKLHFFQERISDRNQVDLISRELLSVSSQLQSCREKNEKLKEEVSSLEGRVSCSTKVNSVPAQLEVSAIDKVFANAKTSNN